MKIGILGVGPIGRTLATTLSKAGHEVIVANSKGPETIAKEVLLTGAKAVKAEEAVVDRDVIILSIPLNRIPEIGAIFANVSDQTVVIDTSNYYPSRDGNIESLDSGQVESLWVSEQIGRPIAKAWNAIGSDSFATKGGPAGSAGRIAIPIAADREDDRTVTIKLVSDSGFDAYDAGSLADSWRQQPGSPVYCTDLILEEIPGALEAAERDRISKRRDLAVAIINERMGDSKTNPKADYLVALNRLLYI